MSTLDPTIDQAVAAPRATPAIVTILTSSDHKVIGRLLVALSLLTTAVTALLGVLLGIERIDGSRPWLIDRAINALFAGSRVGLVLGAVVPLMLGLCVAVVPLQLGARALAFPRAALAGVWAWFGGLVLLVIALIDNGGPGGADDDMVVLYLAALALMTLGLTTVAVTVATSVLTTRAPGMRLERAPLFSWSALVFGIGLVLALPVLFGVLVYLVMDVRYATGATSFFGGADGIDAWASWLFTGPSLALFAVPAVGILAETGPLVFRRRLPTRGVVLGGIALVGLGVLAAVTQKNEVILPGTGPAVDGHNWLTKFGVLLNWAVFTLAAALGILIVIGAVARAARPSGPAGATPRPRLLAPFVFALGGVLFVLLGVVATAVYGIERLDLIGTVFAEGAAVAIVYGSVLAGLGGVALWLPKWSGRRMADGPAAGLALLGALAVLAASVPYLIAGFADQPAGTVVFSYSGPAELWNVLVTVGHGLFGLVLVGFAALALRPGGDDAAPGDDPWDGQTLEWATTSPAPPDNFTTTPVVRSPEPLLDLKGAAGAVPGGRGES